MAPWCPSCGALPTAEVVEWRLDDAVMAYGRVS